MPAVTGDRFSSQNLSDCAFCVPLGRQFRTQRQCSGCSRPLCLVCRPAVPGQPLLCPECGGGPPEAAIQNPTACIDRITAAGQAVPFWLEVLRERLALAGATAAEEMIVPE